MRVFFTPHFQRMWQARVTKSYRFYFTIEDDSIILHEIRSHPK